MILSLLLYVCVEGGRGKGGRKGRNMAGSKRVWHEAESEEECGNYTKLMVEEKPADLCIEKSTKICICATKDDLSAGAVSWVFKCGSCDLKWRPEKDEPTKRMRQEKRKTAAKEKRMRRMERVKLRRKLSRKNQKKEKDETREKENSCQREENEEDGKGKTEEEAFKEESEEGKKKQEQEQKAE